MLSGVGDSFSTASAAAFESAATPSGVEVCRKATYEAGSTDMRATIKKIMDKRCCLVTVLFGQAQDISSLLLEAHRQKYMGEWMIGDIIGGLDGIISDLKNHLDEPVIHELLRGLFACILKVSWLFSDAKLHKLHHQQCYIVCC